MLYPTELQLHIDLLSQASQVAASLSIIESLIYYMKNILNISIEFFVPLNGIQPISTPESKGRGLCETDILKRRLLTASPTLIYVTS